MFKRGSEVYIDLDQLDCSSTLCQENVLYQFVWALIQFLFSDLEFYLDNKQ